MGFFSTLVKAVWVTSWLIVVASLLYPVWRNDVAPRIIGYSESSAFFYGLPARCGPDYELYAEDAMKVLWEYYIEARSLLHQHVLPERIITVEELNAHDGSVERTPMWLCIGENVFDVTTEPKYYGADGMYSFFTGHCCDYAFCTGDFSQLDRVDVPVGVEEIDRWVKDLALKYPIVGRVPYDVMFNHVRGGEDDQKLAVEYKEQRAKEAAAVRKMRLEQQAQEKLAREAKEAAAAAGAGAAAQPAAPVLAAPVVDAPQSPHQHHHHHHTASPDAAADEAEKDAAAQQEGDAQ